MKSILIFATILSHVSLYASFTCVQSKHSRKSVNNNKPYVHLVTSHGSEIISDAKKGNMDILMKGLETTKNGFICIDMTSENENGVQLWNERLKRVAVTNTWEECIQAIERSKP